ncbi:hypothetical protein QTO34_005684 [Cnephaeus nilssonii]|uniref:Uncharacterized protein n=1 Tax=Cnephaeus nilssonii TaxID=3371016 RepID=A0AA40HNY5_CNENI|nr:hypothetical protein QTO34_005684 [Eptesicus nilssonii]
MVEQMSRWCQAKAGASWGPITLQIATSGGSEGAKKRKNIPKGREEYTEKVGKNSPKRQSTTSATESSDSKQSTEDEEQEKDELDNKQPGGLLGHGRAAAPLSQHRSQGHELVGTAAAAVAAAADSAQRLSVKEEAIFLQDGPIRVTDLAQLPTEILGAPETANTDLEDS